MKKKWLFVFFAVLSIIILFFFVRWLYSPYAYESTNNVLQVFNSDIESRLRLESYSNNYAIQLLNIVMPIVKVNYENEYGCPVPGLLASAASNITDGLHTDIRNPITYLNYTFTAFSQYEPYALAYDENNGVKSVENENPPDIINFDKAPEGAIFFSEEDEYKAEGQTAEQQPAAASIQNTLINEAAVGIPGKIALEKNSHQILIYHSHSTESYIPNTAGNYHTSNEKLNVLAVGSKLAKELQEKYKYKVLHDKTPHDKVSYAYSYVNSLETIKNSINKYKSIKVILDLHRDAFDSEKLTYAEKMAKKGEYTATVNGKNAARIMLVIAKGNPNYAELEKFAVYIKKKMDKLYPGLFLKIDVKSRGKYNQYFSNHSMLVEVGCMLNTIEEAEYSSELFARVIGEVINDLKE